MFKKSCCLYVGLRCDIPCVNITTLTGHVLPWTEEIKYLGIFIVQSRAFKCAVDDAKCSFYRAANDIFGKVGRLASEEVSDTAVDEIKMHSRSPLWSRGLPSK